jgi:tRNA pseudouridine55 synthase
VDLNKLRNSILLIDKDRGRTSFNIVSEIKRILNIKKVGHSGTLDKFATGLLVICTGQSTKLSRFFLNSDKRYIGVVKLGSETDTLDDSGEVIERGEYQHLTEEKITDVVSGFKGVISQMPPQYSALKIKGKRASDIVRSGKKVELKAREVTIYNIDILDIDIEKGLITIDVFCSKGTYIRSLARDIGKRFGSFAHLISLRRIESGDFSLADGITVSKLRDVVENKSEGKFFLNPLEALKDFNRIIVDNNTRSKIFNGVTFRREDIIEMEIISDNSFVIIDENKDLIAIADIDLSKWHVKYLNVFVK